MRIFLTAHDIANSVRMTRTLHKGAILIVEGDTDARIYMRFIDETQCKVIPSHGKNNAINALDILENDNFEGILAIIDADFWKLDGILSNSLNLLLTDTHDLETMIISSEALEKVLSEFGSAQKIKRLGKPIRDVLLKSALPIGFFRWISSPTQDDLRLRFEGLSFNNFVDRTTLKVDINQLISQVKTNSQNPIPNDNKIKLRVTALTTKGHDPWQVCSGHDLVEILSIGLKNIFGNRKARRITPGLVDGILRVAYEYSYFCLTQLYNSIEAWGKANPSFKVLN